MSNTFSLLVLGQTTTPVCASPEMGGGYGVYARACAELRQAHAWECSITALSVSTRDNPASHVRNYKQIVEK